MLPTSRIEAEGASDHTYTIPTHGNATHTYTNTGLRGAHQPNTAALVNGNNTPVERKLIVCIDGTSNQYSDKVPFSTLECYKC